MKIFLPLCSLAIIGLYKCECGVQAEAEEKVKDLKIKMKHD
jgi:hypothetical protein